ncbi:hypothetical protein DVA86_32290 [Streptomyces armeniacus]|uniref:Esterase family protein n=1 Tax=Streptomyces armeniacus TaxID=83291 RepID=A0A345XY47_9ACTN|nr:alpha/beta hydrolase family protein [Streptomyces armeniacus]AXK36563.1 hypothetical protein DVA86_32290 [Streptomyces armeniacus]
MTEHRKPPEAAPAPPDGAAARKTPPFRRRVLRPGVITERRRGRRVTDLRVASPGLDDVATVRLLTPDGWRRGSSRTADARSRTAAARWPVLLLLPGADGECTDWTELYGIAELPQLRDVLVVMPSMPLYGFCTDWWNGGAGGPPAVETFHLDELLPLLERDYGAGTRRVVAGQSQGGFGALSYAARRPGLFRAVASFSGFVHPLRHTRAVRTGCAYLGIDWRDVWGDPVRDRANWLAHAPYHLAERLRGSPVYLSCGDGRAGPLDRPDDEPEEDIPGLEDPDDPFPEDAVSPFEVIMRDENEALADRLHTAGVSVRTHFTSGTHSPPYWGRELRRALPTLLRELRGA